MVPIDSSLKHASTSILLCQIISSFAKDTSVLKNCKNGNLFFLLFYTTDLVVQIRQKVTMQDGTGAREMPEKHLSAGPRRRRYGLIQHIFWSDDEHGDS